MSRPKDGRDPRICVAQIGAAHGLRGGVHLRSFTEEPGAFARYGPLEIEDRSRRLEIDSVKPSKDGFTVRFVGITRREQAELLRNVNLYVDRDRLPAAGDDEFYYADLIGLAAVTPQGDTLGKVIALHNFGAGDIVELKLSAGDRSVMLAFDEATVPEIDIAGDRIVVAMPEETLGENNPPLSGGGEERAMTFHATVLTIFPDMFPGPLGQSLAGKALAAGAWSLDTIDIRDFGIGVHRQVDDTPAGGGPGMVMKADVLARAIDSVAADRRPRLLMSPRGRPLTQQQVIDLAAGPGAVILCGRFEGVDERLIEARGLEEVSVGDYVLSGGEIGALVLLDACIRLLPGVMGKAVSAEEESFAHGLLEYPHYTRPQVFEGRPIPDVLVSGDHGKIAAWRRSEAERLTKARRPDLWDRRAGQDPPQNRSKKSPTDG